mmetsp:Transcript_51272/g.137104  ORF Transcript_51272/g.137104 Transcript_51272/m.137104 type:complete len:266 (+) Transcript_51272:237-1034(+)
MTLPASLTTQARIRCRRPQLSCTGTTCTPSGTTTWATSRRWRSTIAALRASRASTRAPSQSSLSAPWRTPKSSPSWASCCGKSSANSEIRRCSCSLSTSRGGPWAPSSCKTRKTCWSTTCPPKPTGILAEHRTAHRSCAPWTGSTASTSTGQLWQASRRCSTWPTFRRSGLSRASLHLPQLLQSTQSLRSLLPQAQVQATPAWRLPPQWGPAVSSMAWRRPTRCTPPAACPRWRPVWRRPGHRASCLSTRAAWACSRRPPWACTS